MAPVRAVWGYPHTVNKCNTAVTACNSYSSGDRNKSSDGNMGSEENLSASVHVSNDESDTIRPIELNDFRKYTYVHAVYITFKCPLSSIIFTYVHFSDRHRCDDEEGQRLAAVWQDAGGQSAPMQHCAVTWHSIHYSAVR